MLTTVTVWTITFAQKVTTRRPTCELLRGPTNQHGRDGSTVPQTSKPAERNAVSRPPIFQVMTITFLPFPQPCPILARGPPRRAKESKRNDVPCGPKQKSKHDGPTGRHRAAHLMSERANPRNPSQKQTPTRTLPFGPPLLRRGKSCETPTFVCQPPASFLRVPMHLLFGQGGLEPWRRRKMQPPHINVSGLTVPQHPRYHCHTIAMLTSERAASMQRALSCGRRQQKKARIWPRPAHRISAVRPPSAQRGGVATAVTAACPDHSLVLESARRRREDREKATSGARTTAAAAAAAARRPAITVGHYQNDRYLPVCQISEPGTCVCTCVSSSPRDVRFLCDHQAQTAHRVVDADWTPRSGVRVGSADASVC